MINLSRFRTAWARPYLHYLILIHDPAANYRCEYFASELPAVEGGVVGFREGLGGVVGPALFWIEDGDVGVGALG